MSPYSRRRFARYRLMSCLQSGPSTLPLNLRIVFIGLNWPFTIRPLKAVVSRHELVGIAEPQVPYSSPSYPRRFVHSVINAVQRSRAFRLISPPLSYLTKYADRYSVPYLHVAKKHHTTLYDFITDISPDLVCITGMPWLLPQRVLDIPRLGVINVHPSLLPNYRGPNPWFWQWHTMEKEGGVTIHFVDAGEDTGDILSQATYPIALGMTYHKAVNVSTICAASLLVKTLADISAGNHIRIPQRHLSCPVRARRIRRGEALVDWQRWPLEKTWHILRGCPNWFDLLPTACLRWSLFHWTVGDCVREATSHSPGALAHDREGPYIVHPEGKIRIVRAGITKGWNDCSDRSAHRR